MANTIEIVSYRFLNFEYSFLLLTNSLINIYLKNIYFNILGFKFLVLILDKMI